MTKHDHAVVQQDKKAYMEIKMKNDGVVPFQTSSEGMKPYYLTGIANFSNAASVTLGVTKLPI